MVRKSVQGGYCEYPDANFGCALTKLECEDPANFFSSRQMQNGPVNAHGGSCRWQDSVRDTVLGKCKFDENDRGGVCASTKESCPGGVDFSGDFVIESLTANPEPCTVETTLFGRCDYGMCAWSHDHCIEDNTWEAFDEGCTCDKVQVGACSRWKNGPNTEREVFCAVSEFACDNEQSWVVPQEVMGVAGFDCFLCREETVLASNIEDNLEQINSDPSGVVDNTNIGNNGATIVDSIQENVKDNTQKVAMVATIVGVGIGIAFAIIGLVTWKVFRTKRAVKRAADLAKEQPPGPPTGMIDVDVGNSLQFGNSTDHDMDNASVLSEE